MSTKTLKNLTARLTIVAFDFLSLFRLAKEAGEACEAGASEARAAFATLADALRDARVTLGETPDIASYLDSAYSAAMTANAHWRDIEEDDADPSDIMPTDEESAAAYGASEAALVEVLDLLSVADQLAAVEEEDAEEEDAEEEEDQDEPADEVADHISDEILTMEIPPLYQWKNKTWRQDGEVGGAGTWHLCREGQDAPLCALYVWMQPQPLSPENSKGCVRLAVPTGTHTLALYDWEDEGCSLDYAQKSILAAIRETESVYAEEGDGEGGAYYKKRSQLMIDTAAQDCPHWTI